MPRETKRKPRSDFTEYEFPRVKEFTMTAIDFVHSLNIGGGTALDGSEILDEVERDIPIIPVTKKNHQIYRCEIPGKDKMVDFDTYRGVTGQCETCGSAMNRHPRCDACGILCGLRHFEYLPSVYREHTLCGHCIGFWKALDCNTGRQTTYDEFVNPRLYPRRRK